MRDRWVYKRWKLVLSLDIVIEYFGWNVDELKNVLLIPILLDIGAFFNLEEMEIRQIFFWYTGQVWYSKQSILYFCVALIFLDFFEFLIKCKDFLTYLVLS